MTMKLWTECLHNDTGEALAMKQSAQEFLCEVAEGEGAGAGGGDGPSPANPYASGNYTSTGNKAIEDGEIEFIQKERNKAKRGGAGAGGGNGAGSLPAQAAVAHMSSLSSLGTANQDRSHEDGASKIIV